MKRRDLKPLPTQDDLDAALDYFAREVLRYANRLEWRSPDGFLFRCHAMLGPKALRHLLETVAPEQRIGGWQAGFVVNDPTMQRDRPDTVEALAAWAVEGNERALAAWQPGFNEAGRVEMLRVTETNRALLRDARNRAPRKGRGRVAEYGPALADAVEAIEAALAPLPGVFRTEGEARRRAREVLALVIEELRRVYVWPRFTPALWQGAALALRKHRDARARAAAIVAAWCNISPRTVRAHLGRKKPV